MIMRKQITDSSLNLSIPSKLSCPESAQLCQDLGSRETLKCFSTISLDTMMKIIMASKPSSCILDPIPTKLLKELLPVLGPPLLNIINGSLSMGCVPNSLNVAVISSNQIKFIYIALRTSADISKCCTETQPKTPNSKQCRC